MRTTTRKRIGAMLAGWLMAAAALPATAGALGDLLRDSGWERVIGTWVDQGSKGEKARITFGWKFEGQVLQVDAKAGDRNSVALIGVNPKNGEVYHVAADDQGGGALGKWEGDGEDAILSLNYVGENGDEGEMRIRHHFADQDTLVVTVEGPESMTFTLVRERPAGEG